MNKILSLINRDKEVLNMCRFKNLGVIKNKPEYNKKQLNNFESAIDHLKSTMNWDKKISAFLFFWNI